MEITLETKNRLDNKEEIGIWMWEWFLLQEQFILQV